MNLISEMATSTEQPCQSEADCCWEAVVPPEIKSLIDCVFCNKDISLNADEIKNAKLLLCLHSICQSCADSWKAEGTKKLWKWKKTKFIGNLMFSNQISYTYSGRLVFGYEPHASQT